MIEWRAPYSVKTKRLLPFIIFPLFEHRIVYEEDTVIYSTRDGDIARYLCAAMNLAHRVGFYDAQGIIRDVDNGSNIT